MNCAIIGGGAAGFFLAINLKEMAPTIDVTIFERSKRVLAKVAVSGGGRCNCTNTFDDISDLQQAYPRGHRLLKRLFRTFNQHDAYQWFEHHGVPLVTQADNCVFPRSQDAQTIINMFTAEARRHNVNVRTGTAIHSLDELRDYDFIVVTTGGQPKADGLAWLQQPIVEPVPSLFTFSIDDDRLHQLMGTVVTTATAMLPGTKLRATGPLLITHWGMSGPCILRLSSYGARLLHDFNYQHPLAINWTGWTEDETRCWLKDAITNHPQRQLPTIHPPSLNSRLWNYLTTKSIGDGRQHAPYGSLNKKEQNRLIATLTADTFSISGRAPFKDEFVTCGGIDLQAVDPVTLESRSHPNLFFAGEVLDIDGITGGFNFQAAWTTAYTVAKAIEAKA
jgi:predicted Rossmann fold flavoprotein